MTDQRPSATANDLDIRVALVLYGGVSLAIYENGVTRCFYELVKGQGIFKILLDLLGATAQVDVIAGTSAGGINGVLLAATLEAGTDFTASETLWRNLGDLGNLMRDPRETRSVESLLKGDTYYQDELIAAFRRFCTRADGYEYPLEMDVFVTGTDLDGQERLSWDKLNNQISDKEHRVVFHLEHRPQRKALGCVDREGETPDPEEQGTILGTIARITSSFPAAFPPFRLAHLEKSHAKHASAVGRALHRLPMSRIEEPEQRTFADGGLLDNKPFGPVLEAIFHRMPTGPAQRILFYVEPDPEPRSGAPDPTKYTPLAVGSLSATISSHETIWNDLKDLDRHNARVRWFGALKKIWIDQVGKPELKPLLDAALSQENGPFSMTYWNTRMESLSRSLFIGSDSSTASAEDDIADPDHKALADAFAGLLREWTIRDKEARPAGAQSRGDSPLLNAFDPDYHLRRSFHALYLLYDAVREASERGDDDTECRTAMRLLGRVIKTQKMIRDVMIDLRRNALKLAESMVNDETLSSAERTQGRARLIVNLYRLFLRGGASHWDAIRSDCDLKSDRLRALGDDWQQFFASGKVSQALKAAQRFAKQPSLLLAEQLPQVQKDADLKVEPVDLSVRWTILDEIEQVSRQVLAPCEQGPEALHDMMGRFAYLDVIAYPLEFTAGMYELDEISYTRISPQDAQVGLSKGEARSKVAGDDLFHFAAFLRKDWRSNDILRGRLDGICQIISSLLAPTAENVARLKRRRRELSALFDASLFASSAEAPHGLKCVQASWESLCKRWAHLGTLLDADGSIDDPKLKAAWTAFAHALVLIGQEDAFVGSFEGILQDHYCQEVAFGEQPRPVNGESDAATPKPRTRVSEPVATKEARDFSAGFLRGMPREAQWTAFERMNLGAEDISGRDAAVPPHISGEYMTQGYLLLWGMVHGSLGRTGQGVLDRRSVRLMLRHPLAFLNAMFLLMRGSFTVALASIATTTGILLGIASSLYFFRSSAIWVGAGALAALLLFMTIVAWAVPRARNKDLLLALLPAVLVVVLGVVVAGALHAQPLVEALGTERSKGFLLGAAIATVVTWVATKTRSWRRIRRKPGVQAANPAAIPAATTT